MSDILFFLTRKQAEALVKIDAGERYASFLGGRGKPFLIDALYRKAFITAPARQVDSSMLTPLGRAAAQLARQLLGIKTKPATPATKPKGKANADG